MFKALAVAAVSLSAASLAFAANETAPARADGDYTGAVSMPVGQAPACYNLPKKASFKITGTKVVFARCASPLAADGSFHCSIVPRANAVLEWAGHVVPGNAVEGTLTLQVTIPPPAVEKGNSCRGTFRASRQ